MSDNAEGIFGERDVQDEILFGIRDPHARTPSRERGRSRHRCNVQAWTFQDPDRGTVRDGLREYPPDAAFCRARSWPETWREKVDLCLDSLTPSWSPPPDIGMPAPMLRLSVPRRRLSRAEVQKLSYDPFDYLPKKSGIYLAKFMQGVPGIALLASSEYEFELLIRKAKLDLVRA